MTENQLPQWGPVMSLSSSFSRKELAICCVPFLAILPRHHDLVVALTCSNK